MRKLDVPYQSQFRGNNGLNFLCGPACLTMLLRYIGVEKTMWKVYLAGEHKTGLVSIQELVRAAAKFDKK